jgi:hypothetical protein
MTIVTRVLSDDEDAVVVWPYQRYGHTVCRHNNKIYLVKVYLHSPTDIK